MYRKLSEGKHKVYLIELHEGYNTLTGKKETAVKVGITSYADALDRFFYSKNVGEPSMIDYFERVKCVNSVIVDSREEAEKLEEKILQQWSSRDFFTTLYMKGILEIRQATLERLELAHQVINKQKAKNVSRKKVLYS